VDLPLVTGRALDERDLTDGKPVCLVNEAFVRGPLAGRSPLGMHVAIPTDSPRDPVRVREIVGVARQVKGRPDEADELVQLYVPMAQDPIDDMFLLVRPESGDAAELAPQVRAAIGRVDKEQLVSVRAVTTLEDVAHGATSRHRLRAVMVTTFAGLALSLAMVGVFGILAYSVQQRSRDFAVRRALGHHRRRAAAGFRERGAVGAAGAVIGLVLSLATARLLLIGLGGLASVAGQAWRAARVDPAVALRDE
jgi:putative ABC transport system permease protein